MINIYHSHCSPNQSCSSVWPHLSFPVNLFVRCSPSVLLLLYSNAQQPFRCLLLTHITMGFFIPLSDIWQFNQKEERYTLIRNNLQKSEAVPQNPTYIYMLVDPPALDKGCRRLEIKTKTLLKKVMCYRGPGLFRKSYFQLLHSFRQLNSLFGRNHFNRHFQVLKACQKRHDHFNTVELKFVTQVFKHGLQTFTSQKKC